MSVEIIKVIVYIGSSILVLMSVYSLVRLIFANRNNKDEVSDWIIRVLLSIISLVIFCIAKILWFKVIREGDIISLYGVSLMLILTFVGSLEVIYDDKSLKMKLISLCIFLVIPIFFIIFK